MTTPAERTRCVLEVPRLLSVLDGKRKAARKGQNAVLVPLELIGSLAAVMRHYPTPAALALAAHGAPIFAEPGEKP